jgi:WD40 repeat protein
MVIPKPVQFSPDGKWLSGFANKSSQVVIWNAKTGDVRNRFNVSGPPDPDEQQSRFELLRWSPSGKALLAVLSDRTVRIWDVPTGEESQRIAGHDDRIWDADFFADESQVITASEDGTVRLWGVQSGNQLQRWDYPGTVHKSSVTPDGRRLLTILGRTSRSGTSNVDDRWFGEIRDVKSGKSIRKWELPPMGIAKILPFAAYPPPIMSPSGRLVLTTVWADGEVEVALVDAETGVVRRTY